MNIAECHFSNVLQVAIDSATPVDDAGTSGNLMVNNPEPFGYGAPPPMRAYGRMYGSLDFDDVSIDLTFLVWFIVNMKISFLLLCEYRVVFFGVRHLREMLLLAISLWLFCASLNFASCFELLPCCHIPQVEPN